MTGDWSPGCYYKDFGFSPDSVHVRFEVDEVTLGQDFLSTCFLVSKLNLFISDAM